MSEYLHVYFINCTKMRRDFNIQTKYIHVHKYVHVIVKDGNEKYVCKITGYSTKETKY